jgi:hypothetical protein
MNAEGMSLPLHNLQNIFSNYRNTVYESMAKEEWEQV